MRTPAPAGGIVILYAAGLGETDYFPLSADEIPLLAGRLKDMTNFRVYLNGKALDPSLVLYAGSCPGWAGLYQINFFAPTPPLPFVPTSCSTFDSPNGNVAITVRGYMSADTGSFCVAP